MTIQYLGNCELLYLSKTAFLASSIIPTDMVLRCYDWALRMCQEKQCVISGFSSYLEKNVLHFLLKGQQPIIIVLARRMYQKIPSDLQTLIDNDRLLIISTTSSPRQSRKTAFDRNRYICSIADQIVMIGASEKSSLAPLKEEFSNKLVTL